MFTNHTSYPFEHVGPLYMGTSRSHRQRLGEDPRDRWRRPGSIDWPPATLTRPPAAAAAASNPLKHPRPLRPPHSRLPLFSFSVTSCPKNYFEHG